jgi:hypothetical protein
MCRSEDLTKMAAASDTRTTSTTANTPPSANDKPMKQSIRTKASEEVSVHESQGVQALLDSLSGFSFLVLGFIASCAVFMFSVYFPFMLAPSAASKTYDLARFHYDESISHFDNTIWTYGTDYILAFTMTAIALSILRCDDCQISQRISSRLRWRSAGLLLGYAASTLAGALAHQFYTTLESRNSLSFRVLWTICVGTVCFASAFMGSVGTELARQYRNLGPVPVIHENFWLSYGATTTLFCITGGLSYQRPACDIFIAGTNQIPSTMYMMALFYIQCGHPSLFSIRLKYRFMGACGFILNAPLLPMYPLLIQYTDWSLASVNTLLHSCLFVAWGMQGLSLRHLAVTLARSQHKPFLAVPMPPNKKVF